MKTGQDEIFQGVVRCVHVVSLCLACPTLSPMCMRVYVYIYTYTCIYQPRMGISSARTGHLKRPTFQFSSFSCLASKNRERLKSKNTRNIFKKQIKILA